MGEGKKRLLLGCGNPARGDDGLGPAFIAAMARNELTDIETRVDYQLRVEDAMDIGEYSEVIIVDASRSAQAPFEYRPVDESTPPATLDTHSLSPEALIHLARTLFDAVTPASVLAIRGYRFEPFIETLSPQAEENLQQACRFLLRRIL